MIQIYSPNKLSNQAKNPFGLEDFSNSLVEVVGMGVDERTNSSLGIKVGMATAVGDGVGLGVTRTVDLGVVRGVGLGIVG